MIGLCFHSFKDGVPEWQGKVVDFVEPNSFEVLLYSWLTGEPNGTKVVPVSEMAGWHFYETNEDMITAYEDMTP